MSYEDHDLLIRVDENVKELKRIVVDQIGDHEARLRVIERETDDAKGQIKGMSRTFKFIYAILTLIATAFGGGAFVVVTRMQH
jgi:hypothetical protein